MKSEILQKLEKDVKDMQDLIANQKFTVGDAQKFLNKCGKIYFRMEERETSNIGLREKNKKLKEKIKELEK